MTNTLSSARDWAGDLRSYGLAWGIPTAAIIVGLFLDVPLRAAIWTMALAWMGTACLLNARRCGRTHCRFTGPYYLIMILPVLVLGFGPVAAGTHVWLVLAVLIVFGGKIVWWLTERAFGKFS